MYFDRGGVYNSWLYVSFGILKFWYETLKNIFDLDFKLFY